MDLVISEYNLGLHHRNIHPNVAIFHFTRALEIFHHTMGSQHDPMFWSRILLCRAEAYLQCQRVDLMVSDVKLAINNCPQQDFDEMEMQLWLNRATTCTSPIAVWCYTAALHFAAGVESSVKSKLHVDRALGYCEMNQQTQFEEDIKEAKLLDSSIPYRYGFRLMNNPTGIGLQPEDVIENLEIAELFLRPLNPSNHPNDNSKKLWHNCCDRLLKTLWCNKVHHKAIHLGKKWQQIEALVIQRKANEWKKRGNEMFTSRKYHYAVSCYTLSLGYTPPDNVDHLGIVYSNRSQAYLQKKQFNEAKNDARRCLEKMPDWSKGYYRLGSALAELGDYSGALEALRKGLGKIPEEENKYEIVQKILTITFKCPDGVSKITFEIPRDCMSRYLNECVDKHHWKSLEMFLLGGGGKNAFDKGKGGVATGNCDLHEMSLSAVVKCDPKPNMFYELIETLIAHGASVNGLDGQERPLTVAVNFEDHDLAVVLLKKNAHYDGLLQSKFSLNTDTPLHTAFRIGLSKGHWQIFHHLIEEHAENLTTCESFIDKKGNSLYHLVSNKMWPHVEEGIRLLRKYKIDPRTKNKDGKTSLMMIRQHSDVRYQMIEQSVKEFAPESKKKKKRRKNRKKDTTSDKMASSSVPKNEKEEIVDEKEESETENKKVETTIHFLTEIEVLREKIVDAIQNIVIATDDDTKCEKNEADHDKEFENSPATCDETLERKSPFPPQTVNVQNVNTDAAANSDVIDDNDDVMDNNTETTFDKMTWEVECTAEVWKKMNDKKLQRNLKKNIVRIIKQLAKGQMRGSLAKPLVGIAKRSDIRLFEAKLDRSARILWERAIAFSPRCSALAENKNENSRGIYTEVIRIWDIVLDHDTVPRKIDKIVRSYDRGTSCFIKKKLKGTDISSSKLSSDFTEGSIPKIYVPKEEASTLLQDTVKTSRENSCSSKESTNMFFPPGSSEETEYHIVKFYAFSNAMVNAMLDQRLKTNFDFPFRVSELEHSVINLKPKPATSILLLGRSGTGKTTCCLYRLWNNYQTYWKHHTLHEPTIPNIASFVPRKEKEESNESDDVSERVTSQYEAVSSATSVDNDGCSSDDNVLGAVCPDYCLSNSDEVEEIHSGKTEQTFEHLHQVFITKNAVLCKEVKKNFFELRQACFSRRDDLNYEQSVDVNRFQQLKEESWPLFICSRDWLLMLDASLPGAPFFARNDDGTMERSVKGWNEEDSHLQELPLDHSDDEDDEDEESDSKVKTENEERKHDPRREITFQLFKNELWRKMTKKKKVDFHASLVWTEIISFIKGSVEALNSDDGYISLEEYRAIGNKRAQTFTADREIIYDLFKKYQSIKRNEGMFDEADVVYNIYHRLRHHVPVWSMHEIYVDETQDFTQAELSVIIRCCRNPNALFFTGDTAQSIMRGIAFRFSDLRSLFFYMKESMKSIGQDAEVSVPDRIYELTHNYRSHSGILNLASSVTDLLSYFFPDSFDKLARDQGLFEGPKPVLLHSCTISDLAVILRGHRRKTSPIEFGAHQVILVASDEVRQSLPEELSLALVMTIYEAKGLEFDDVLIYNFFKDSQALKEWRVVGTYKEKKEEEIAVSATGIAEIPVENMEYKARPLEFNPDQHKILISEFKYLYTALTRARVNVWIFDESEEARAPMFEYFQKRNVVTVKSVEKTGGVDTSSLVGMFAQKSEAKEWKDRGVYFYDNGRWKAASQCFSMAHEEIWVKKCTAQIKADEAATMRNEPRKLRLEFVKAALFFIECGMLVEAQNCLFNARERILRARLYERSKNFLEAAKLFRKEHKLVDAAKNFELAGDYQSAADCFLNGNKYDDVLKLTARYNALIENGEEDAISKHLRPDQRDESICYRAAKFYKDRKDIKLMNNALERLPNVKDRITFLQNNGFFEQAAELLVMEGKPQEAAKLLRSKGKFLDSARLSNDKTFIADCYLLEARSTIYSVKENNNTEIQELVARPLNRAAELYEICNNVNGQAEVILTRGRFNKSSKDVDTAGNLFFQASNYAGLAECFSLLMMHDTTKINRYNALQTLKCLLDLILAFHKKVKDSREQTMITMCYAFFGVEETDDEFMKKAPQVEMVRMTNLTKEEYIPTEEADYLIKERLYKMTVSLVKQIWMRNEETYKMSKHCPRFLNHRPCDMSSCVYMHEKITRKYFADQFYALLFLVEIEMEVSKFLNQMNRESAKTRNRLESMLYVRSPFDACNWMYELLFPTVGEPPSSFFLSEADVSRLRRFRSEHIKNFARDLWKKATNEDRLSNSDLFTKFSNLMHLAGCRDGEINQSLATEERKYENGKVESRGMFPDKYHGGYRVFFRSLELSKKVLYSNNDVLGSVHKAIRQFLFTPAKRKLPHPSITNAVAILERQLTTCLVLYSRVVFPNTIVCLPENYLSSMINFWDFVDRRDTKRTEVSIYYAVSYFQGNNMQKNFQHFQELVRSIVELTFGKVNPRYNIFQDALCGDTVNFIEAERVLVLVLTMLCNCGRVIPQDCEEHIRVAFITSKFCDELPVKLQNCLDAVRNASSIRDIVSCLGGLLKQSPFDSKLCDVHWNGNIGRINRRDCNILTYSMKFNTVLDLSQLQKIEESRHQVQQDNVDDETIDEYVDSINDDISSRQYERRVPSVEKENNAAIIIQRTMLKWLQSRKQSQQKRKQDTKIDFHFQEFKVDKSGCSICTPVDFTDHSSNIASSEEAQNEGEAWRPRLLKRDTFETHCAGGSPHWKQERLFAKYKTFYTNNIFPIIEEATNTKEFVTQLCKTTDIKCDLDLDRLDDSMSRLRQVIKRVEDSRSWNSFITIKNAAEDLRKLTKGMVDLRKRRGSLNAIEQSTEQDEDEYDDLDESTVGLLKTVSTRKKGKPRRK